MFNLRRRAGERPFLVGHRGAMAVAPENTIPSLEAGLAGGADILELDVQLTADGQVILFHDTNLLPKTGIPGQIRDYDADFLRGLDVGRYFHEAYTGLHMPLLDEVLTWAKGRTPLMIEIKSGPAIFDPELDRRTVSLIEKHDMADQVVIISFDHLALRRIKQANPAIAVSVMYTGRLLDPLLLTQGLAVDVISPATDWLTPEDVQRIHEAGYACSPGGFWWDYPTLLAWGVDSISSNDPASVKIWSDVGGS